MSLSSAPQLTDSMRQQESGTPLLVIISDVAVPDSVPILEACPQIQSSTTLKVTLQCVPFVSDILVIPVFAHFFRHLLGNSLKHNLPLQFLSEFHGHKDG